MQTRFRHQNKPDWYQKVSDWNKYSKSTATQLFYHHTPIDTVIYEKCVCYNHKTKYIPYQMMEGRGHLFTYMKTCERGQIKDF